MNKLMTIIQELDSKIEALNQERTRNEEFLLKKASLKVLGQISLMANEPLAAQIHLDATADLDALLDCEWVVKQEFEKILKLHGLQWDSQSHLIWIPEGSKFNLFYDSPRVRCELLDPLYCILSKAIKAPEKNRDLVAEALAVIGDPLAKLILKNGGKLEYFLGK